MAKASTVARVPLKSADIETLITNTLGELKSAIAADSGKFFPSCIELIDVHVKVFNVEVNFKVAGPKAQGLSTVES